MKKCPLCGMYAVSYDPHFRAEACLMDGCTMVMTGEETYSYLETNESGERERVEAQIGEKEVGER